MFMYVTFLVCLCLGQTESTLKQCTDAEQGEVSTCYQLVKSRRNWQTAKSECQQRGMALASIGSPEEMSTIRSMLSSYDSPNIWIGLSRNNGQWEWLDGSPVNNVGWAPDQPQNAGEDCGAYWGDHDIHDVGCHHECHFLCEDHTRVTTEVDHCASSPCGDNGECFRTWTGHVCSCHVGYTGTSCDIEIDHCASSPCGDTADCFSHSTGYLCSCRPGFSGPNCDIEEPCNAENLTALDDPAWPPNWLLPVIMGMAALELTIIVILLVVMRCCFKRANEKPNKRTTTPKGIPLRTPSNSHLDQSDYQIPDPEDAIPRVQCSGEEAELYENPTNDYAAFEDRAEDEELYEVV